MIAVESSNLYLEIGKYTTSVFQVIDEVKKYILEKECTSLTVDASRMNMIDATKTCILCSTFHFAKYPEGSMLWLVHDKETMFNIRTLRLKNISLEVKPHLNDTIRYFEERYRTSIL